MNQAPSQIAQQVDNAFWIIGAICLVLLVGITVAMIFFVLRYPRHKIRTTAPIAQNLPLEIAWIAIPTALVLFMFFLGLKGFRLGRTVPPGAAVIRVIAQQWVWSFSYPQDDITSDKLYLPVGRPVKLLLTSKDVIHGFYLPAFRVKEDVVPGRENYLVLAPEKIGTYNIFCSSFCGTSHAAMLSQLIVLSPADYDAWRVDQIAQKNKPVTILALDPNSPDIKQRQAPRLFVTYCSSCHGLDGVGGLVAGARNFTSLQGWKQGTKITDIFRTLATGIPGTQMRSFSQLPPWDRFALAHHVAAFYHGPDRPAAAPADFEKLKKNFDLAKPPILAPRIPVEQAMQALIREANQPSPILPDPRP